MHASPPIFSRVLVVMVVYNKVVADTDTYRSLLSGLKEVGQTAHLLIYDNSPQPQSLPSAPEFNLHYIHDAANHGTSCAYNEAAVLAEKLGLEWLWLFDQDNFLPCGTLKAYLNTMEEQPSARLFAPRVRDRRGLLSPFRFSLGSGHRLSGWSESVIPLNEISLINAGLLVHRTLFDEVGGYDASIPLDFSDIAFCRKLKTRVSTATVVDIDLHTDFSGANEPEDSQALD